MSAVIAPVLVVVVLVVVLRLAIGWSGRNDADRRPRKRRTRSGARFWTGKSPDIEWNFFGDLVPIASGAVMLTSLLLQPVSGGIQVTFAILAGVLAIGYAVAPPLTKLGAGIIGIAAFFGAMLTSAYASPFTPPETDRMRSFAVVAGICFALGVSIASLRDTITFIPAGVLKALRPRAANYRPLDGLGSFCIGFLALLELGKFVFDPIYRDDLGDLWAGHSMLPWLAALGLTGVITFGLAARPRFTASLLASGVLFAGVALDAAWSTSDIDVRAGVYSTYAAAALFFALAVVLKRMRGTRHLVKDRA